MVTTLTSKLAQTAITKLVLTGLVFFQYYNVIKLQNHVDCTKEELRKLVADLDMDKEYRVKIKVSIAGVPNLHNPISVKKKIY